MKTKNSVTFLIFVLLLVFTSVLTSCGGQNNGAHKKTLQASGMLSATALYPHDSVWKSEHLVYMTGPKPLGGEEKCLECHKDNLGAPKPILNCTTQCHKGTNPAPLAPTRISSLFNTVRTSISASIGRTSMAVIAPRANPTPIPNKCVACHQPIMQNQYAHYPTSAALCTICHDASDKHLIDGKDPVKTKDTADNCYRCHNKQDAASVVHPALLDPQSCITCHSPHGGKLRFFIKANSTKELCTMCHEAPAGVEEKTKHGPVQDQRSCTTCHNPHSSDNGKMLRLPSKDLCLSCHNKEIPATLSDARTIPNIRAKIEDASNQHTGAIMGDCTTCHNPHGSKYNRILLSNYSVSNYNVYPGKGENPYALCFTCHDPAMLSEKNFIDKTGFRKGAKKNMHWEHVVNANGQDNTLGRSCKICHDPHGSNQDFHINESWNMRGNQISIQYTKNDNGGQCTLTCHEVKIYSRDIN